MSLLIAEVGTIAFIHALLVAHADETALMELLTAGFAAATDPTRDGAPYYRSVYQRFRQTLRDGGVNGAAMVWVHVSTVAVSSADSDGNDSCSSGTVMPARRAAASRVNWRSPPLCASAHLGDGPAPRAAIADALNTGSNQLSTPRSRLIDKGLIQPADRGMLEFTIPGFAAFVRNNG